MSVDLTASIQYKPNFGRGRHPKRPEISPQKARQEAVRILPTLTPIAKRTVDLLSAAGAMTVGQLNRAGISARSLRRYYQQYLIDRLPLSHTDHIASVLQVDKTSCIVYTLGPIGLEIARTIYGRVPAGYTGFGTEKIAHDVFVAEVALRFADQAQRSGLRMIWHNKYEATVPDSHGRPALEPDAFFVLRTENSEARFLLEFHNETCSGRPKNKVERYEAVYLEGRWREVWGSDEFPILLVVFTHGPVGREYKGILEKKSRPRFTVLLKSFQTFLAGDPFRKWFDPTSQKSISLLAMTEASETVSILED